MATSTAQGWISWPQYSSVCTRTQRARASDARAYTQMVWEFDTSGPVSKAVSEPGN